MTRPGLGYADAALGTRASRAAAGRASRAVLLRGLKRLMTVLLAVGVSVLLDISNSDRKFERTVESNLLRVNGPRGNGCDRHGEIRGR
ncbi:hypothetical protein GCM10023086_03010 [Streptomyces venetus]|uniref:Uncharacterized protein n=1 Tax=Streptomyces venetus TaxID=1701086 RepID=A0ABP8F261_9ACTN